MSELIQEVPVTEQELPEFLKRTESGELTTETVTLTEVGEQMKEPVE